MKPWPIREGLIVVLLGLGLLVPLLRVTGTSTAGPASDSPDPETVEIEHCYATIRTAHPLRQLEIRHEGTLLCQLDAPALEIEEEWDLSIGPTGLELAVRATWPEGTPESVIEIRLEPDRLDRKSATLWGQGTLDDFMEFQWP